MGLDGWRLVHGLHWVVYFAQLRAVELNTQVEREREGRIFE